MHYKNVCIQFVIKTLNIYGKTFKQGPHGGLGAL